jgi:hypothetical protein
MTARRHAVVAGTGRAGTSFLVRFLDECGLQVGATETVWSDRARAGLEHTLDTRDPLPYVVKDPLLFAYLEQLNLTELQIDALILPMRDLMSAAESRVRQERLSLVERSPRERPNAQVAGTTAGGVLYSLDVVDQARILAVGFHNVLHWAVEHQLPVFLLSFPRMVEDPDYLLEALWPWLGQHCTREVARRAFDWTASAGAVRVRDRPQEGSGVVRLAGGEPDPAALRREVLVERIEELEDVNRTQRSEREELGARIAAQEQQLLHLGEREDQLAGALAASERQLAAIHQGALWRARERLARRPWLYRLARRALRVVSGRNGR